MTNGFGASGSGPGGFSPGGFGPGDYDKLVRQYWNSWGETMRNAAAAQAATPNTGGAAPGAAAFAGTPGFNAAGNPPMPGLNEALAWWAQLGQGGGTGAVEPGFKGAVDQFNGLARSWFELMQQVASQTSPGASAPEIVQAWQRALGSRGDNPFADMFRAMRGPGQQGFDAWLDQAAPYLQNFAPWQGDGRPMLGQPTFGFTREHQQRWQKLIQANLDYQQHNHAYNALMAEAAQNAFKLFEKKLGERSEPGRQLESARALFDLWIEAAEEAYAEIALSPRFREAYGAMVNSQMRLRAGLQREVEEVCELFGMPTRIEVDSAHRKLVQVERELRRIRDALEAVGGLEGLVARGVAPGKPAHPGRTRANAGAAGGNSRAASSRAATGGTSRSAAPSRARQRSVARAEPVAWKIVASDRPVVEEAAVGKTTLKKAPPSKRASKQAAPGKAASKNAGSAKPAARKSAPRKAATKKAATKKASASKSASKKATPAKNPAAKAAGKPVTSRMKAKKKPAGKVRVEKVPVEKADARTVVARRSRDAAAAALARSDSGSWADRARATTAKGNSPPAPVLKRPTRTASKRNSR